jgi:hypothetical protein
MTFEEISRFNMPDETENRVLEQRRIYFNSLFQNLKKLRPSLEHTFSEFKNVKDLERMSNSDDQWNKLRSDTYYACQELKQPLLAKIKDRNVDSDKIEDPLCDALKKARMSVFLKLSPLHNSEPRPH